MDFLALLRELTEAKVDFVVIGGVCATLHGVPSTTFDMDLVHARDELNCERLAAALVKMDAAYREPLPKRIGVRAEDLTTEGHHLLLTVRGPLGLLGTVVGGADFQALALRSSHLPIGEGRVVRLLDLEALIEMKEAIGREKDLAQLPLLRRTALERSREKDGSAG